MLWQRTFAQRTQIVSWLAVIALTLLPAPVHAQDQESQQPITAESLQADFTRLLNGLEAHRIDFALDDLDDIAAKQQAANRSIGTLTGNLREYIHPAAAHAVLAQDYVMYLIACAPRLSGRVLRVGPGQQFPDLEAALMQLQPGDALLLGPGEYKLPDARMTPPWQDVALVGSGPDQTTIVLEPGSSIVMADRLRIQSVRVNCVNEPLTDLRRGGSIHLRDCHVGGYNSGAGGSNALDGNDCQFLIERCTFEGRTGRAEQSSHRGNVLRSAAALYVRQSQFIDNDEVIRLSNPAVFDGCRALNVNAMFPPVSGSPVLLRDSPMLTGRGTPGTTFTLATDDLEFVQFASGMDVQVDPRTRTVVESLALRRRLPYWIGLLRHENAELRRIAAPHLSRLTGLDISPSIPEPDQDLQQDQPEAGAATIGGTYLPAEREFLRLWQWYQTNKTMLRWDEAGGRYTLQPQ